MKNASEEVNIKKAVKFYNAVADIFEKDYYGSEADPSLAFDVDEIWEILKSNIRDGNKVLEIGCGTGQWLLKIENELGGQSYGIDFSPEMVSIASKRGLDGVVVAEASRLPFKSLYFDSVISPLNALDHCVQYQKAFIEIFRVLKSPGIALLMVDNQDRLISRYWHIDAPNVQSLQSDPRSSEMWTHLVDGEEVIVYTHLYTKDEILSLMPGFQVDIRGLGTIPPLIPKNIRQKFPNLVKTFLVIIRKLERFINLKFPKIAAHLFIIAKKCNAYGKLDTAIREKKEAVETKMQN